MLKLIFKVKINILGIKISLLNFHADFFLTSVKKCDQKEYMNSSSRQHDVTLSRACRWVNPGILIGLRAKFPQFSFKQPYNPDKPDNEHECIGKSELAIK